jgi:predicted nucleic acid-binding protein
VPEQKLIYWDTSVFLSYLNAIPDRIPILQAILDNCSKDKNQIIVTSTISKVEVAWVAHEKLNRLLSLEELNRIDSLWNDTSVVEFIEFHDDIAILARDIMRAGMSKGWKLRTNDAIHLASAKSVECQEINVYDDKWAKYKEIIGIDIIKPFVPQLKLDFI